MVWIATGLLVLVVVVLLIRDRNLRKQLSAVGAQQPAASSAFFKLQCGFGETEIIEGRGIVSMVISQPEPASQIVAEGVGTADVYRTLLKIASPEGGFVTAALVYSEEAKALREGDMVICVPIAFREHIAANLRDPKLGWLWEVRSQIDPKADPREGFKTLRLFERQQVPK